MHKWLLGMGLAATSALPDLPPLVVQRGHLWYGTETLHSRSMDVFHYSARFIVDALISCLSLSVVSCGLMICSMCTSRSMTALSLSVLAYVVVG